MTTYTKGFRAMTRTMHRGGVLVGAALLALILPLAGCNTNSLLDVNDPDIITPGSTQSSDGAEALYAGAVGYFAVANAGDNGGTEGQILTSGLMADEWFLAGTFTTRLEVDERAINVQNATETAVFQRLERARAYLDHAAVALETYSPNTDQEIAEAFALSGFTDIYFAENYCEGVPLSTYAEDGSVTYGDPLTRAQLLDTAAVHFDSALAHAMADTVKSHADFDTLYMRLAAVGQGRALLDAGDFAGAAAAVASVPTGFDYSNTHSVTSGIEENGVYDFAWLSRRWSVANNEGGNGLDFVTAGDPRVQVDSDARGGFDGFSTLWLLQNKYTDRDSPVPVADGVEARLIEAEAMLNAGDGPGMVNALNALRADAADNGGYNLPALPDPGTQDGRVDLLFRERAFWLFATGHRLGDMRRLIRQYGRAANTVFPTGTYIKGGATYGTDVNIPVPFQEQNNPNFTGCLNRNP
jgi:hypothetical protein